MRDKLTYANVMATLALFVALGGSSYAALKVTGKNVKDGSLTGRDIKKRSVTLDRLKGKLPAGPAGQAGQRGPAGEKGATGATGTVDTSGFYSKTESDARFLTRAGQIRIAIPPGGWVADDPQVQDTSGAVTERRQVFDYGMAGAADLRVRIPVPTSLGGRALVVRGVEVCYDATAPTVSLTRVEVRVFRSTTALDADPAVVASDTTTHDDQGCRAYALSPIELTDNDFVVPAVRATWSAAGNFRLGRLTLVLEPA